MDYLCVDGVYIINNVEHSRSFRIALPIGDMLSVRAPAETIPATELLLIYQSKVPLTIVSLPSFVSCVIFPESISSTYILLLET